MPAASSEHVAIPTVTIGDHQIGPAVPTYVIAEAGVNHDGCLDKALQLVDVAVEAGADAVKFQIFRAAELATATAGLAGYQRSCGAGSQHDMLARLELPDHDFARIRARCTQRGIEFLGTPFGVADVDRLLALSVRALKIASTDLDNVLLLRRAADTGLPLILSTGASREDEITACVERLRTWGAGERLVLFHCISRYPTPLEATNLRAIAALRNRFGVPCGFSDHTTSTHTGAWAVAAGACMLEKHFTLDRSAGGPDHAMSLDPKELTTYIELVRTVEVALGDGTMGMTELEADVRTAARKSVVAAQPIRAGTVLTAELLTVKRPAGGIPPAQLETVLGRRAVSDVNPDTVLTWDMIA